MFIAHFNIAFPRVKSFCVIRFGQTRYKILHHSSLILPCFYISTPLLKGHADVSVFHSSCSTHQCNPMFVITVDATTTLAPPVTGHYHVFRPAHIYYSIIACVCMTLPPCFPPSLPPSLKNISVDSDLLRQSV